MVVGMGWNGLQNSSVNRFFMDASPSVHFFSSHPRIRARNPPRVRYFFIDRAMMILTLELQICISLISPKIRFVEA